MIEYNPKLLKSKCQQILQQYDDVLKLIIEMENEKLNTSSIIGENEFDTLKKVCRQLAPWTWEYPKLPIATWFPILRKEL